MYIPLVKAIVGFLELCMLRTRSDKKNVKALCTHWNFQRFFFNNLL